MIILHRGFNYDDGDSCDNRNSKLPAVVIYIFLKIKTIYTN